jgi:hypothetical protein
MVASNRWLEAAKETGGGPVGARDEGILAALIGIGEELAAIRQLMADREERDLAKLEAEGKLRTLTNQKAQRVLDEMRDDDDAINRPDKL